MASRHEYEGESAESDAYDDDGELHEDAAHEQRLKAAVHYTVGRICDDAGEDTGVAFSREFIAALAETTWRKFGSLSLDLEMFAKHAKRTTVTTEDVKLCARRSEALYAHIDNFATQLAAAAAEKAHARKKSAANANAAGQ